MNDIKDYWNNHPIRRSVQSDRESRPAGRPNALYFLRENYSEYLFKYDNRDILLVGEESCTDKKDTFYICSDAFYELAVLNMYEYGQPEVGSPTEALLFSRNLQTGRRCLTLVQNENFEKNHSDMSFK